MAKFNSTRLEERLKTFDIGFNGVSVSTDSRGTILQISAFHPKHGIVLAEPYEQFDGSRFRDTPYVRQYRARMLRSMKCGYPGFGIRLAGDASGLEIANDGLGRAKISYQSDNIATTISLQVIETGEVAQCVEIKSCCDVESSVSYTMDFGISVNRASYGQLTEGGPIPIPKSENRISRSTDCPGFSIINAPLGAHLQGCLQQEDSFVDMDDAIQEQTFSKTPVSGSYSSSLTIPPRGTRTLRARFVLRPGIAPEAFQSADIAQQVGLPRWEAPDSMGRFIIRRNLEYILGNCAVPVPPSKQAVCLLADHVCLNLGWNRDNYWQVRFLIDAYRNLSDLTGPSLAKAYAELVKATVKGHLVWVFRFAQRPHGFWHRSYLTTGRPKDGPVFQLDQQCYPLLELCDFWETFPEERTLVEEILHSDGLSQILDLIVSKKDAATGLFPTDETPGDDAVEHPFHFSSHILLWHTFSRLGKMAAQLGTGSALASKLVSLAAAVHTAAIQHFLCLRSAAKIPSYAYLVDGAGQQTFYHDANDLPTLFAPSWGFLSTDVEELAWHNTMKFALSTANEGGYYAGGAFEGLGSVHTRDPWPLGYFQEWRYAQMTGNAPAEAAAWKKICGAMMWDGMFSEAVDAQSGAETSKAWFSWPGSMIASGLLQAGNRGRYL